MSDREPEQLWSDLVELARVGESRAEPLPVERVRALGRRRRARRQLVAAAVAATVLVGGGVAVGSRTLTSTPSPAVSPTVTTAPATPARTVSEVNLIEVAAVPVVGRERYAATVDADDREGDRLSVCTPRAGGLSSLGPTREVDQNFVLVRRADGSRNPVREPFNGEPTVFTRAMQFESATAADAAYATIRSWLERCPSIMEYEPIGSSEDWTVVNTGIPGAKAGFGGFRWRLADDRSGQGFFESLGVAQVGDRIALTVSLAYGQDFNVSLDPAGDPTTGLPPHPQFALVKAAADRLRN